MPSIGINTTPEQCPKIKLWSGDSHYVNADATQMRLDIRLDNKSHCQRAVPWVKWLDRAASISTNLSMHRLCRPSINSGVSVSGHIPPRKRRGLRHTLHTAYPLNECPHRQRAA
ncbi:hypothetical protein AFLA_005557 [Aspergillus flavus NRRL3357]|nr:hypothetical protein AFLA_005557 [Aspergillus flavus NRRL3357]